MTDISDKQGTLRGRNCADFPHHYLQGGGQFGENYYYKAWNQRHQARSKEQHKLSLRGPERGLKHME